MTSPKTLCEEMMSRLKYKVEPQAMKIHVANPLSELDIFDYYNEHKKCSSKRLIITQTLDVFCETQNIVLFKNAPLTREQSDVQIGEEMIIGEVIIKAVGRR